MSSRVPSAMHKLWAAPPNILIRSFAHHLRPTLIVIPAKAGIRPSPYDKKERQVVRPLARGGAGTGRSDASDWRWRRSCIFARGFGGSKEKRDRYASQSRFSHAAVRLCERRGDPGGDRQR